MRKSHRRSPRILSIRIVIGCLTWGLLSGCASTRQFVPKPDISRVTAKTVHVELKRSLGFGGWANGFTVHDNGTHIGDLGPTGCLLWERESGPMTLVVGPKMLNMGDFSEVSINLRGATKYTFTASFPFGYPITRNGVQQSEMTALAITQHNEPLVPAEPLVDNPATKEIANPRLPRSVSVDSERATASTQAITIPKPRFSISAHVEDDPGKGVGILGNGDGRIQKGEAFDLVVIVANTGTTMAKSVTCMIIMPENKSIKAYGELQHVIPELAPAAAITNRFNLVMPLSATTTEPPTCSIEVRMAGSDLVDHLDYAVPAVSPE